MTNIKKYFTSEVQSSVDDGRGEERLFVLIAAFCSRLILGEVMPYGKILNIFTVNVFFSFMISVFDLAPRGYEKIKSSREKKLVGLIFSFSVKHFMCKLDPNP